MKWRRAAYRAAGNTGPTIEKKADKLRSQLQNANYDRVREIWSRDKEDLKRNQAQQAALDRELFFNKPNAKANLDKWSKMPGWKLEEGVSLSFGKDPDVVKESSLKDYISISPFARQYASRLDRALRAEKLGQLTDLVLPKDFLEWAIRSDINVPAELVEKVEAHGGSVADWKARFETLRAQYDEERKAKNQQIAELTQELEALREQNEKLESRLASDPPLHEKERNSLLKMVLGMAVDKYGYIPGADRNRATGSNSGSIPAALDDLDLPINPDTVNKHLKEATARFGKDVRLPLKP